MQLALLRRSSGLARPARALCTVVPQSPLLTKCQDLIAELKAPAAGASYDPADFEKDMKAGTVNFGLLQDSFSFSDEYKKLVTKDYNELMKMKMENAKGLPTIDWDSFDVDEDFKAELKSIVEAELKKVKDDKELVAEMERSTAAWKADLAELMSVAKAREAAAAAGITDAIAELEIIEKDITGIKTVTLAEILENEPALRAEVEAEIAEHNWAP